MSRHRAALVSFLLIFLFTGQGAGARDTSSSLYRQASSLAQKGKIDEAIPLFKRVIQINPCYTKGHYGLGKAYLYRENTVTLAIKHLGLAVSMDRKNAKAYFYLGIGYMIHEKYVPAIHAFADAYRNDSTMIEALYNIGAAYDMMGNGVKAKFYFDKYIQRKEGEEIDISF